MEAVPPCQFATSPPLYFYTKWGGLDLDFMECGIPAALRHPLLKESKGWGEAGVWKAS
jgi:hypothetical protein